MRWILIGLTMAAVGYVIESGLVMLAGVLLTFGGALAYNQGGKL